MTSQPGNTSKIAHAKQDKSAIIQAKLDKKITKVPKFDAMRLSFLIKMLARGFFKIEYEGRLPKTGGLVVVANHQTDLDGFILAELARISGRRARFLAKVELFKVPVVGWIMRSCRHIPVIRFTERAKEAINPALEAVKQGECVVVFPEGMLTQDPAYYPMKPRPGAAVVAITAGVPLVPVMIEGAYNLRPCGWGGLLHIRWKKIRTKVKVKVLEPVDTSDLTGPDEAKIAITRAMQIIKAEVCKERAVKEVTPLWDARMEGHTWFW